MWEGEKALEESSRGDRKSELRENNMTEPMTIWMEGVSERGKPMPQEGEPGWRRVTHGNRGYGGKNGWPRMEWTGPALTMTDFRRCKDLTQRPPVGSCKCSMRNLGHKRTNLGGTVLPLPLRKRHCTFLLLIFKTEELPFLKDPRWPLTFRIADVLLRYFM